MKKKLLILSPKFPPVNSADNQRVRMMLPYLDINGWEADVLAVDPKYLDAIIEPDLKKTIPSDVSVSLTKAFLWHKNRYFRIGDIALRSFLFLYQKGKTLIRENHYDLIFISTTVFPIMTLGPLWKKKFNIPYVLDFQDPWVNDCYSKADSPSPPGGKFKYGIVRLIGRCLEPFCIKNANKIITVSSAYPEMFISKYKLLKPSLFQVIPFSASAIDFSLLKDLKINQNIIQRMPDKKYWVYVGRGGNDMSFSLSCLFKALKQSINNGLICEDKIELYFIGTDYAETSRSRETVMPIAKRYGVSNIVHEYPERIPFLEAMSYLQKADLLMVPGSNDSRYTASKIYPYILADKPILAIFHENSSVVNVIKETNSGTCVTFNSTDSIENIANKVYDIFFKKDPYNSATNWQAFEKYSAKTMTANLCNIFHQALE